MPNKAPFRDREDAGQQLVEKFPLDYVPDLVLAIPRGGLPVAYKMANGLKTSMDVLAARKLKIPGNPEAGFGAVSFDGSAALNESMINGANINPEEVRVELERSERHAKRLMWIYRQGLPPLGLENRSVVITDDGLATGYTMLAAVACAKRLKAKHVSVVVPCAHDEAIRLVKQQADSVSALYVKSEPYFAVADFYQLWWDLTDREAAKYLGRQKAA